MTQRQDPVEAAQQREVIALLWNARDWAVGARWFSLLIAVAGFACAYFATTPESPPAPRCLIVCLGLTAGFGGLLGAWHARRQPEWVAPATFALPGLIVAASSVAATELPALAVGLVVAGLVGTYRSWYRVRRQMQRAQDLARAHPHLQAAKAWRGEPAVRDPYEI